MAMLCSVVVVREENEDLYSALEGDSQHHTHKWEALPEDAPRQNKEIYSVNTEMTSLGVLPVRVSREKIDTWVRGLGKIRRVQ